jgi:molecular chaperone GrpE
MFSSITKHFILPSRTILSKKSLPLSIFNRKNTFSLMKFNKYTIASSDKTAETKKEEQTENPNTKDQQKKEQKVEEVSLSKFNELKSQYNDLTVKSAQYKERLDEITRHLEESLKEKDLLKSRLEKENSNSKLYAISKFAKDILDVCDNFDRAHQSVQDRDFPNIPDEEKKEMYLSFVEGVEMTQKSYFNTLKKHGITSFVPNNGEKFDTSKHEAHEVIEDTKKVFFKLFQSSESVDSCVAPGYVLNGKVLRPAKVN